MGKLCALLSVAVALIAVHPGMGEEQLRGAASLEAAATGAVVWPMAGASGDESCGCYDISKHKCKCKSSVCSKKSCQNQGSDFHWTGGCSCGCDGLVVGKDCPEKPPHLVGFIDAYGPVGPTYSPTAVPAAAGYPDTGVKDYHLYRCCHVSVDNQRSIKLGALVRI